MNQWVLLWFLLLLLFFGIHFTENGMWFLKPCSIACVCVFLLTSWIYKCTACVPLKPCKFNRSSILSRIFVIRSYLFIMEYHESFAQFWNSLQVITTFNYFFVAHASKHRKFIVFRHVLIFVSNKKTTILIWINNLRLLATNCPFLSLQKKRDVLYSTWNIIHITNLIELNICLAISCGMYVNLV